MANSPKETVSPAPSSPSSPSAPTNLDHSSTALNIQPLQMIPGPSSMAEKLAPKRQQQGVKITENPSSTTKPSEFDEETDRSIRLLVKSILNENAPDAGKDVPTSSTQNAETISSSSKEELASEKKQETVETIELMAPEFAQETEFIDLEDVDSDEEPITKKLAPGIAKRLKNKKGKVVMTRSTHVKTAAQKSTPVTPTTSRWSKVEIPSKKRKEITSSESNEDVEPDVPDIRRSKKFGKKVPCNVPDAPLDNISFHSISNVERWKFVYQRRIALERELGRDALECQEVLDLIENAGLLKTVTNLGDCYESLVREFIVNIPSDITNRKSKEY